MTPTERRSSGICRSAMFVRLKPLTAIWPDVGTISPVSSLMIVDLPLPLGPTKKTNSPSSMRSEMPFKAVVPLSYSFTTSLRRIMLFPQFPAGFDSIPQIFSLYYSAKRTRWQQVIM